MNLKVIGKISITLIFITGLGQIADAQNETPVAVAEAESGTLSGLNTSTSLTGYSGTGYVTGFDNANDKLTVKVNIPERKMYKIIIRYNGHYGEKTQDLSINSGFSSPVVFPQSTTFTDLDAGSFLLEKGENLIILKSNWGYIEIDKFSVYNSSPHTFNISTNLVDPEATPETKALYDFLLLNFGKKIISGQTDSYYDDLVAITGISPMLKASDFQHYTVGYSYLWNNGGFSFGWHDNANTESMIDWYNSTGKKGIVSMQWHWHSPSGGNVGKNTFYTNETNFDVTKAVQNGTSENTAILRDIDSIATQLKKFQKAGVPVLWRPLHEAGGAWFWWGAKGAEACKQLYAIVFDRLKNHHGLHNLIWVWSSPEANWYPGNATVDIIGYDSYPGAYNYGTQKSMFDKLFNVVGGEKLITMSENGPIPDPADCLTLDAPWSYFMSWADLVKAQNSDLHLLEVYSHPDVLTLGYTSSPLLKLSSNALTIGGAANSENTFEIYSNLDWTISSNQSWLTMSSASGTGNASITISAEANHTGQRSATITISGTGINNQTLTVTQEALTGISNIENGNHVEIYPNPNNGNFDLIFNGFNEKEISVTISNQNGLSLNKFNYSLTSGKFKKEIDIVGYPAGIYFLIVSTSKDKIVTKVLKR